MSELRTAVPAGDYGFRYAWRRADGRTCCAVNDVRQACSHCKGASVDGQLAQRAEAATLDGLVAAAQEHFGCGPAAARFHLARLGAVAAQARTPHASGEPETVRDAAGIVQGYSTALRRRAQGGR